MTNQSAGFSEAPAQPRVLVLAFTPGISSFRTDMGRWSHRHGASNFV